MTKPVFVLAVDHLIFWGRGGGWYIFEKKKQILALDMQEKKMSQKGI